jgi:hypothetical protein
MHIGKMAQTKLRDTLPTITEHLGNLNELSMSSGQSTPARGSFHNLTIPPATPINSPKSALHVQHILARVCETLVMTIKSLTRLRLLNLEPGGRLMEREAQTQLSTTENLGDSDLSMLSGQSTPAHGSLHDLPIPPATSINSFKPAIHVQHILGRVFETLVMTTTRRKQGPTTPRRCRPTHGLVTIKPHPEEKKGIPASLCIEIDLISVVSETGLDDTILSMPVQYAELKVVPNHDNVLCLKVKTPGANANGIFVVVSDCSARDRWLEVFLAFGVKIEGSASHISLTSAAQFDRLCSNNETDGRALKRRLKHETQTQQRAYRNQPRLWAPSRIRFTSEAEFDRLCSNDQPEGRPLKRETQTQQRAYRNQPRLWAPSRIRFTSEAEFDRLCSNDESEGLL